MKLHGAMRQWVCKQDYDKFAFEDSDRYFLKRFVDFKELHQALRAKIDNGQPGPVKVLPELPKDESFGFRRQLAAIGMSSFLQDRKDGLQKCLNAVFSQVPRLEDEPLLPAGPQGWFAEVSQRCVQPGAQ